MGGTTGVGLEQGSGLTELSGGRPGRRPGASVAPCRPGSDPAALC